MKKASISLSIFLLVICFLLLNSKVEASEYIIYIDPGHGGVDGGAFVNDIKESELTLEISKKLKEIFEENGLTVLLTRETDDDLCDDEFIKREDMLKRVNMINRSNATLALSIHLNRFSIAKYRGAQVFYNDNHPQNSILADMVQKSLGFYLGNTDRKIVKRDNIFLLNKVSIPCCIIECGFMSNPEEFALLQSENYQYKIANSLLYAVQDYLRLY